MGSRISWRRGFFRLWLVLAVPWTVGFAVLCRIDSAAVTVVRAAPAAPCPLAVRMGDGTILRFPAGTAVDVVNRTTREYLAGHPGARTEWDNGDPLVEAPPDPGCTELELRRLSAIDSLWFFAVVGLGPPAFLLALGLAAVWVVRGFIRAG